MIQPDDYAAYLSDAATSETSIFHDFRVRFYGDATSLHVFFEGAEDLIYYMPILRQALHGADIFHYVCGGKPKVKELRDDIYRGDFKKSRCAFFVDRDYDDYLGTQIPADERTYISEYYSIENDIVSDSGLNTLLLDLVGLNKTDPEYKLIMTRYAAANAAFVSLLRPFCAWTIAARRARHKTNLNNVKIENCIQLGKHGVPAKKIEAFDIYRKAVGLPNLKLSISDVKCEIKNVCQGEERLWIRGKFYLWFFRAILINELQSILVSVSPKKKAKFKIPAVLMNNALFEAIGGRLPHSKKLDAFLLGIVANLPK
jgi:hypothetical protein